MNTQALLVALADVQSALELIAAPVRPDGTYNRDRRACEELARKTLQQLAEKLSPTVAPLVVSTGPVVVYSDGACKGNPGDAGWGAVVLIAGAVAFEQGGYIGHATNQIAELRGAIEGLALVPEGTPLELVSDSQYVLKGISEWRKGWERNGWRNSSNQPVANAELWKQLFALVDRRTVTTRWVKGHSGNTYNERCDELANQAITASRAGAALGV